MKRIRVVCEPRRQHEKLIDIELAPGDELLDPTDFPGSPIIYSCRGVACGSCFIHVSNPEMLEPPDDNERAVLHSMGADCENHRMACACRLKESASGTLHIKMAY